ncbi:MAG: hypothetical protein JHC26_01870 [Thermofilum sp.]|jgi:predicted nucleic-acid-binding Zn-ribbon protein/uncharacterized protein YlbG (UPF0298 family)|uniref:hypothetical protein n=1 Tax=Thermofilum sp. TaxID=1961369 RepID=UPI00258EE104|nr:hypothetical protein [Thermofilum sp.]MCI4407810.1 hypothetical protein [Thermofilum sp.]
MEIWELDEYDDDNNNRWRPKKLICPRCGKRDYFYYIIIIRGEYDKKAFSYGGLTTFSHPIDTHLTKRLVLCKECKKVIFSDIYVERRYEVELAEKEYNHEFIDVEDVSEDIKSLFTMLLEEVKRYSELCKQYYGALDSIPDKDWNKIFGLDASNTPGLSIGEDMIHVFLDNGSVHVANNNGKMSVLVVYKESVENTLEELKKPEVTKLIEEMISKLKRENDRLEAHIALENMLE